MPGFRQPPTFRELLVNRKRWEELPPDLQAIDRDAAMAEITRLTAFIEDQDSRAAEELTSRHDVQSLRTPEEVLRAELDAEARKNSFFARVLASQREFTRRVVPHARRIRPPGELAMRHSWPRR